MLVPIVSAEISCFSYAILPDYLFDYPISNDARILYSKLLRRVLFSAINPEYIDTEGHAFVIFPIEEVKKLFRCGEHKACQVFRELEDTGLIHRRKLGQGRPSLIYPYIDEDCFSNIQSSEDLTVPELSNQQFSYNKATNISYQHTNKHTIKSIPTDPKEDSLMDTSSIMSNCMEQLRAGVSLYESYYGEFLTIPFGKGKRSIPADQLPELLSLVTEEVLERVAKRIISKMQASHKKTLPNQNYIHNALLLELLRLNKQSQDTSKAVVDPAVASIQQVCGYQESYLAYPLLRPYMDYVVEQMATVSVLDDEAHVLCHGFPMTAGDLKTDFAKTNLVLEAAYVQQNGQWEGMDDNVFVKTYSEWARTRKQVYGIEDMRLACGYAEAVSYAPQYKTLYDTMMNAMLFAMNLPDSETVTIHKGSVPAWELKRELAKIDCCMLYEAAIRYRSLQTVVAHPVAYFIRLLYSVASEYESFFETLLRSGRESISYIQSRRQELSA